MLLSLDFGSDVPIYLQIRNQIVNGIAEGELSAGERIPALRTLADELGVNMMTVNKAYTLLKQEGYISTDRRGGSVIASLQGSAGLPKLRLDDLRVIASEAKLQGMSEAEFVELCVTAFSGEEKS